MHLARSFNYPFFILFFIFHKSSIHLSRLLLLLLFQLPTDDGDLSGIGQIYLEIGHCRPAVCPNFFTLSFWRSIHTFLIDMCLCVFINPENISKERRRRKKDGNFCYYSFLCSTKLKILRILLFYFALSLPYSSL